MQLNPLIKNCFIERVYKSDNTFGKFPLEVKPTILKRRGVLKSEEKSRKIKFLFPGKILINKTSSKILGCYKRAQRNRIQMGPPT